MTARASGRLMASYWRLSSSMRLSRQYSQPCRGVRIVFFFTR